MTTATQMKYCDRALLDPAEYLELRRKDPGRIKQTKIIPPRIGRDKHLGKILVVFSHGYYGVVR
jgi:hypothetical protein